MRILFLSDNFYPESNAPATRLHEHAIRWVAHGHDVTVLTCAPNFPEGRLFAGYRNAWHNVETIDGIRVVRVKTYITANEGFVRRTLDYMSFMVGGAIAGLFERRPDVVVATSPQFFCAVGGWVLSALRRLPFVFELRDLWPASIVAVGAMKDSLAIRILENLELFLYRRANAVISVTRSFKDDLVERGITATKIHVVRNGVDLDRYAPCARDFELETLYHLRGKFVVGYLGTHGMAHGLEKVLEAIALLRERKDIAFVFAGGGAARKGVEDVVVELDLNNVVLIPRQPKEMMPRLWSLCDISLIPLRNNRVFSTVIPSKLFEGMGMGIPVLMSVPEGEATNIVRQTGVGSCVPPDDPPALSRAIAQLAVDPERIASYRAACRMHAPSFSRDRLAQEMANILQSVCRDRS